VIDVQARSATIDIVLASYNGSNYIQQQIESIQSAIGYIDTVKRFIIVDDGSTDGTISIVRSLMAEDSKIELHQNFSQALGPMRNFERGIAMTTADWIMLSDQDDKWVSDKIQLQLLSCTSLQKQYDVNTPILCFSDKRIVDSSLEQIAPSFIEYWAMPTDWHQETRQLALINVASGCTMMFNQALIQKALPIPNGAYMHDWWLILHAKQFGQLEYIDKPLVNYRIHGNNTLGKTHNSYTTQLKNVGSILQGHYTQIYNAGKQAHCFTASNQLTQDSHFSALNQFYETRSSIKKIWLAASGKVSKPSMRSRVKAVASVAHTTLAMQYKFRTSRAHHAD
jgi:glycosyltransferase involved in cell wall biosynthesis